jgi:hypothetical protein
MELAARCEAAEGPDRELDASIWLATTEGATRERWDYTHKATGKLCHMDETRDASRHLITVPYYTASIDAAMTLAVKGISAADVLRHAITRCSRYGALTFIEALPRFVTAEWLRALAQQENEDE